VDLLGAETTVEPVYCIDLPKPRGDSITPGDLRHLGVPGDARGLLVRTGFFRYRSSDPEIYTREHPWVHPGVVGILREKLPALILFGVDTISISNPVQRNMGHEAHRSFLCEKPPIMLLEDLDLSQENLSRYPWKLTIYPLFLDELDGVPVIVFLEQSL
jgi:kynurenine formamidase